MEASDADALWLLGEYGEKGKDQYIAVSTTKGSTKKSIQDAGRGAQQVVASFQQHYAQDDCRDNPPVQ